MVSRNTFASGLVIALLLGGVLGAWYMVLSRPPAFCEISGRPIHPNMHTVAEVDGKKLHACCAQCALTLGRQEGKPVRLIRVTDFATAKTLSAERAWFVEGSEVQMCASAAVHYDEAHTPYARVFDRCLPSLVAFAREEDAREFVRKHAGVVKRLADLTGTTRQARTEAEKDLP